MTVESQWHGAIFCREVKPMHAMSTERQQLYRRLVRSNIFKAVTSALDLTWHHAGEHRFASWFSSWLDSSPPKERIYWKLPVEFAMWFLEQARDDERLFAELAHFEALQIMCGNAPNSKNTFSSTNFADDNAIQFDESCRLGLYHYPVYSIQAYATQLPTISPQPEFLILSRRNESVHWSILEPEVAQFLAQLAEGVQIEQALAFIQNLYSDADTNYLRSQLVKLNRLGILWSVSGESS